MSPVVVSAILGFSLQDSLKKVGSPSLVQPPALPLVCLRIDCDTSGRCLVRHLRTSISTQVGGEEGESVCTVVTCDLPYESCHCDNDRS